MPVGHLGRDRAWSPEGTMLEIKIWELIILSIINELYQSKKEKRVKVRESWKTFSFKKSIRRRWAYKEFEREEPGVSGCFRNQGCYKEESVV